MIAHISGFSKYTQYTMISQVNNHIPPLLVLPIGAQCSGSKGLKEVNRVRKPVWDLFCLLYFGSEQPGLLVKILEIHLPHLSTGL